VHGDKALLASGFVPALFVALSALFRIARVRLLAIVAFFVIAAALRLTCRTLLGTTLIAVFQSVLPTAVTPSSHRRLPSCG